MNPASLDWALCRTFLAILRHGSLSSAARALEVAHPTVRRHLDELEAVIGAALFMRSPSGLVPTALALDLREAAEAMESAGETLMRLASANAGEVAGAVRITASEVMGVEVLAPMLARIKAAHPRLDFELVITNKVQDILRRDADIAVRMARPTQPELLARKIGETKLGIYAHRDWLAAHGTPASLEALVRGRGMVGYDREDTSILRALASRGVSAAPSDFCFRSDSDLAQLAAIRAGIGAGACQIKIADRDPNLMRIAPEQEFALEIWLAVSAGYRSVARLRVVFEALARELRVYGSPD